MSIFDNFLATPEVSSALSDSHVFAAMLQFQAALARAQGATGLIPLDAAQSIIGTCKVGLFDVPKLVRESAQMRCLATPLINSLRETVALFNLQAAAFVSLGCSADQLVDGAMALVSRDALALIQTDTRQVLDQLLKLARQHAETPLLAGIPAPTSSATSFDQLCTQWAAPLARSHQRLHAAATEALCFRLGEIGHTNNSATKSVQAVLQQMTDDLHLKAVAPAGQPQADSWAVMACELALLCAALGRIAADIWAMSAPGMGEPHGSTPAFIRPQGVANMAAHGQACMVTMAAAQRAPQRVATLMAGLAQGKLSGWGHWQAGLAESAALMTSAHGAARSVARLLALT